MQCSGRREPQLGLGKAVSFRLKHPANFRPRIRPRPSLLSMDLSFATCQLEASRGRSKARELRRRRHRGGCVWGGGVPSLLRTVLGREAVPPPRRFLDFGVENGSFWCILGTIYADCSNPILYGLLRCTSTMRENFLLPSTFDGPAMPHSSSNKTRYVFLLTKTAWLSRGNAGVRT